MDLELKTSSVSEERLYERLSRYEIKTPPIKSVGVDDLIDFSHFPAVIKIQSSKVVHKSDVGGVMLNLRSNEELHEARLVMKDNLERHGISLDENDRFLVTQMVDGEELYVGCINDSNFGHVISFGKGGTQLELYKDVCYIDSNADRDEIERSIRTTKISKLFDGFRGSKYDIESVISLICNVQKMLKENPGIVELDINPIKINKDGVFAVDARVLERSGVTLEQTGECAKREKRNDFFSCERVVVVGASTDPTKVGHVIAQNSMRFKGDLFFVNSSGGTLFGKTLFKSIGDIDGDIDTAILAIPVKFVLQSIKELILKKIKNLIIITAGFKEVGLVEAEKEIAILAKEHNFNVLGPNCLGFYYAEKDLNATFGTENVLQGNVALVSQSGAVMASQMDRAYELGIGFSHMVSIGNALDLNASDFISILDNSPQCQSICMYLEGISDGKSLCKSIRECSKPIFLLKSGKSEASRKAAFSHTGNLSGSYSMFDSIMRSLGVNMVNTLDALIFSPMFRDMNNIVVITNAGGPGTLLADAISAKSKSLMSLSEGQIAELSKVLPSVWSKNNPIDIIGDALPDRYKASLDVVNKFDGVDLVYVLITPQEMTDSLGTVREIMKDSFKFRVVFVLLGGSMVREAREFCAENRVICFPDIFQACEIL